MRRGKDRLPREPIIDSAGAAALLAPAFEGLCLERLGVLHLDRQFRPIRLALTPRGTSHAVTVPMRAMMAEALRLGSHTLILAHNHPAGDPTPSRADRSVTRRLVEVAAALEIAVLDHLIFATPDWISFRAMGLM